MGCCISKDDIELPRERNRELEGIPTPTNNNNNFGDNKGKLEWEEIAEFIAKEDYSVNGIPNGWAFINGYHYNFITLDKQKEPPQIKNELYNSNKDLNYDNLKKQFESIVKRDIEDIFSFLSEKDNFNQLEGIKAKSPINKLDIDLWVLSRVIEICIRFVIFYDNNQKLNYDEISESTISLNELQDWGIKNQHEIFLDLFENKTVILNAITHILKLVVLCRLVIPPIVFAWESQNCLIPFYKPAHDAIFENENLTDKKMCVVLFPGLTEQSDNKVLCKSVVMVL